MEKSTFIKQVLMPVSYYINDLERRKNFLEEVRQFYDNNKEIGDEEFMQKATLMYSLLSNNLAQNKTVEYLKKINGIMIFFLVISILTILGTIISVMN